MFGNIFDIKFWCLARLFGLQRKLQYYWFKHLEQWEDTLRKELSQILLQEEIFWKQKSRINCLPAREQSTRFFHTSTVIHQRRNRIDRLKVIGREWYEDHTQLKVVARKFYRQFYTREYYSQSNPREWTFPELNHRDKSWLNRPISDKQIRDTFFQIGANKAPSPDSFAPCFFQQYWHILRSEITEYMKEIFVTGKLPLGQNDALICMIMKGNALEKLTQFHPISLCNVLVKAISKVFVNCMKPLMTKLVGSHQSSFIPGKSIIDNVVVAQKVIHSLNKRNGGKDAFVLKVDLEKTYDRVDWLFLKEVLRLWGSS